MGKLDLKAWHVALSILAVLAVAWAVRMGEGLASKPFPGKCLGAGEGLTGRKCQEFIRGMAD